MSPRQLLIRLFGFGLLGLTLSSCAGADATAEDSLNQGGQTGSLIPKCLLQGDAYVVPEGDTAFAQQVSTTLGTAKLTDAMGNSVPLTERREGNTSILQTDETLTPGTYTLTQQCSEFGQTVTREIEVVEAMPLPEDFGTLAATQASSVPFCSEHGQVSLTWTPSTTFLAYVNLSELTLYQADQELGVIAQAEPYALDVNGNVVIDIPLCPASTTCLPGKGEYRVEAKIAGEEGTWASATIEVTPQCKPDPVDDESGPCSVAHGRAQRANTWPLYLLPLVLWVRRRRAKRQLG